MESTTTCFCKGIRICNKCQDEKINIIKNKTSNNLEIELTKYLSEKVITIDSYKEIVYSINYDIIIDKDLLFIKDSNINFDNFYIIRNHLSKDEQDWLLTEINKTEWKESQSGRMKQDFGVKINYKKKKIKSDFSSIKFPLYKVYLENKLKSISNSLFNTFPIHEIGNLYYIHNNGAHIDPHIDDTWIWGKRIIGINLLSDAKMTFSREVEVNNMKVLLSIDIPLIKGDIYMMTNESRYDWKHSIKKDNLVEDRLVITLREFIDDLKYQI